MPALGVRNLNQKAVLWAFSVYDDYGDVKVSAPVEIDTRWQQQTTESVGGDGSPIAVVGSVDVDRDIEEGSIMWLGKKKDLPSTPTSGLMEVISLDKIPDIKGRINKRTVSIRKYKDSLPTVV